MDLIRGLTSKFKFEIPFKIFIFFSGAVVFPYIEHEFYSISCAVITIRTETRNGQKNLNP